MKDDTPSRTALAIALLLIILGGDKYGRSKCPPGSLAAQKLLLKQAGLPLGRYPWIVSNPLLAKVIRIFLWLVDGNLLEGIGVRKCYMEEHVRTCLARKTCTQVLILAAGYDTLAWRLSGEYSHAHFFEVDHPATAQVKARALTRMGLPQNLHLVPADLTKTSPDKVLSLQPNYDMNARTVVVMEGLLFYLSETEVKGLFQDVADVVGPSSSICFDFFGWDSKRKVMDVGWLSPVLHELVKRLGEPWKWGIDPQELAKFFHDSSWSVIKGTARSAGCEKLACVERKA